MLTLYRLKPLFQRWFRVVAGEWMTPNMATAFGLFFSAAAGAAFYVGLQMNRWVLLAVGPLLIFRLIANVLDGLLARERGLANARGELLNEVSDATGDCLAYVPAAIAVPDATMRALMFGIIVAALLGELTGVVGKVTTGVRRYDGPWGGKGDRWFWLTVGAAILALWPGAIAYGAWYLSVVLAFVILTWLNRFRAVWSAA